MLVSSVRRYSLRGAIRFLRRSFTNEGFFSLWRGNSATLVRIVPFAAIQYASHEQWKMLLNPTNDRSACFLYHKHCLSVLEPLQCCCLVLWSKSYSLFTLPCLVAICVYTADTDKTRQFCLVHVGGVNKLLGLSNTEYHDVVPVVTGYYYWLLSPSGYYRKHLTCSVK